MSRPDKKYLVIPGIVTSKFDGEQHYIDSYRLTRLYGVKTEECVFAHHLGPGTDPVWLESLIQLTPRQDGNYKLPEKKA